MTTGKTRPWPLIAGLVAVVLLAAHLPVLLGGQTWADTARVTEVLPAQLAAVDAVAGGGLPGWWERAGLGAPLWAEPAHGATYPAWWLAAVAPGAAAWLLDALAIGHALIGALGAAALARRWGADDLGAVVAGATLAASDVVTGAVVAGTIGAVAWLPWAAWAGDVIARPGARGRRRVAVAVAALAAAVAAAALSGRFLVAADAALLAVAVAAIRARRRGVALAWAGGGVALAAGLAAAAWLPAALHLAGDVASATGPRPAGSGWALLELIAPRGRGLGVGGGPGVFVGGAAVMLAIAACATGGGGARALGGVAIAFALAGAGLAGPWDALVGADRAAAHPADHLAAAGVVIAALAGVGFARLAAGRPDRRTLVTLAAAGAALVVIVVALGAARPALARGLADGAGGLDAAVARVDAALGHAAVAAAIALAACGLLVAAGRRPWPLAIPAAGVLVVGHAVVVGRLAHPTVARDAVGATPALIAAADRGDDADARAALARAGLSPRLYRPEVTVDAVPDDAPDAAAERHQRLEGAIAARFGWAAARWPAPGRRRAEDALWIASAQRGAQVFDRFAIDAAIVPANVAVPADLPVLGERAGWALVAARPRRPRAFLAPRWAWFPDDAAILRALFPPPGASGLPLGAAARLGEGDAPPAHAAAAPAPCDVRADAPERVVVHCDGAGGVIVVADAWAPGWSVAVDGAPAALERIDVASRGVAVGPGPHVATFTYAPPGRALGAGITAASVIGLAGLLLAGLLRSRDR